MIKRTLGLLLLTALILVLSTGCYDIRELDKISIVTGVAIDKSDKPGSVELTVQVTKADAVAGGKEGGSSNQESPVMQLEATDTNVFGALNRLKSDNSRVLFLHHNQVLILGEPLAQAGIRPYIDSFMRNHESHMNVQILVADGNAGQIMNAEMELEKISSVGIRRMLTNRLQISESLGLSFLTLVSELMEPTSASVAPIIRIVDEQDSKRLSLTGMAVFRSDKMVGELTERQVEGFTWLMGDIKNGSLAFETEQGNAELEIANCSSKFNPVLESDGNLSVTAEIQAVFNIGELKGFEGINLKRTFELVSLEAEKEIKNLILSCFDTTKRLNADIYGLGEYMHRYHPEKWKKLKYRWDEIYPTIRLTPIIKVKIMDTGRIGQSPKFEER